MGHRFSHISTSLGCFCPRTIFSKKKTIGLLVTKDNHQRCSRLSYTDSPCSVWGHGWTTCLLYDGPLLGLDFQLPVGVKIWYVGQGFFLSIPCLCLWFIHYPSVPYYFSSQINLFSDSCFTRGQFWPSAIVVSCVCVCDKYRIAWERAYHTIYCCIQLFAIHLQLCLRVDFPLTFTWMDCGLKEPQDDIRLATQNLNLHIKHSIGLA